MRCQCDGCSPFAVPCHQEPYKSPSNSKSMYSSVLGITMNGSKIILSMCNWRTAYALIVPRDCVEPISSKIPSVCLVQGGSSFHRETGGLELNGPFAG